MKMQYHNISGVKKEVCTAEQKIAYNLAQAYGDRIQQAYNKYVWQFEKNGVIRKSCYDLIDLFKRDYPNTKYNLDAIFCCLGAGLEDYIKMGNGNRILTSFESIGAAFPANYL